jgi:hypothetical protein
MNNEEISKKLDQIEDEIEKLLTKQAFVTFLHLNSGNDMEIVWRNAQRAVYTKLNSLSSENKKKAEDLIKEHVKFTNQFNLKEEWSKLIFLEAIFKKYSRAYQYECTFIFSLSIHQFYRWTQAKPSLAEYCLKSTIEKSVRELRQSKGLSVPRPDVSIIVKDGSTLLKDKDGNFDMEGSKHAELQTRNLSSKFSVYSHIPDMQDALLDQIKSISKHPFMYTLYDKTARKALWDSTFHQTYYAAKFVYDQLSKGVSVKEAEENAVVFMRVLPDRDLNLTMKIEGKTLPSILQTDIASDTELSDEDAKMMTLEILNALIILCKTDICAPEQFYELEFRKSTEGEKEMEGSEYSVDLFLLDENSKREINIMETYVVTLTIESLLELIHYATRGNLNPSLYPEFPGKLTTESIADFLNNPWGFLERKETGAVSEKVINQTFINSSHSNIK